LWEIYFGTDYDTGNLFDATKVDDLVIHDLNHVERISRGDRVNENKSMDANGMLGIENRVLILVVVVSMEGAT
jgi:hypothetical protein